MRGGATWTTHRFHARCDRIVEGRVEGSLQDSVLYEWRKLENKNTQNVNTKRRKQRDSGASMLSIRAHLHENTIYNYKQSD